MSEYYTMYRCKFASFVDFAFRELHPGEMMQDNWHIRFIANLLQFMWDAPEPEAIRRIIFNLPPGYLKTLICSVAFPAWILGRDPRKSALIVSETQDMALEIRERCAELMGSRRYRALFPRARIVRSARDLELNYGGRIRHAGVGYTLPHRRSDLVVLDNPQSLHNLHRFDASSFQEIGRTLKDPMRGMILLATRRLGEHDLSAYLRSLGNWGKIEMPIASLVDQSWNFLPGDNYAQARGEPLNYWYENWDKIEEHIQEFGGDAFSWQYMQGSYRPQATGQRTHYVDGKPAGYYVGSFDATSVTLEDFAKLKEEYQLKSDPMRVELPGFPRAQK